MNTPKYVLIDRAQAIADATGTPRWVKWTSLGWRIEAEPSPYDGPMTHLDFECQPRTRHD